MKHIYSQISYP